MPFAAPAVAFVSAAASAYGAYSSAQAQRTAANNQATGAFYQGSLDAAQYGYQAALASSQALYDSELNASDILGQAALSSQSALLRGQQNALGYRYEALHSTGRAAQAENAALVSRMQQDAAKFNANVAERGAQQTLFQGEQAGAQVGLVAGMVKSSQRAAMAGNGIDLGEGSAAEVQAGTDLMKLVDMNTIQANAARAAWGQRVEKMNFLNQASLERVNETGLLSEAQMERLNAQGMLDMASLSESQGQRLSAMMSEYGANAARVERERGLAMASLFQGRGGTGAQYLSERGALRGRQIMGAASGISPWGSAGVSLLGSVTQVAPSWYAYYKSTKNTA